MLPVRSGDRCLLSCSLVHVRKETSSKSSLRCLKLKSLLEYTGHYILASESVRKGSSCCLQCVRVNVGYELNVRRLVYFFSIVVSFTWVKTSGKRSLAFLWVEPAPIVFLWLFHIWWISLPHSRGRVQSKQSSQRLRTWPVRSAAAAWDMSGRRKLLRQDDV